MSVQIFVNAPTVQEKIVCNNILKKENGNIVQKSGIIMNYNSSIQA